MCIRDSRHAEVANGRIGGVDRVHALADGETGQPERLAVFLRHGRLQGEGTVGGRRHQGLAVAECQRHHLRHVLAQELAAAVVAVAETIDPGFDATADALARMEQVKSDGLIFHSPTGRLMQQGTMFKWKPLHTVDLKVSGDMRLRTRKMTVQSLAVAYHDMCKPTEVWEFAFQEGIHLRPVRKRDDKDMPNSEQTYRDVRTAHNENILKQELIENMT